MHDTIVIMRDIMIIITCLAFVVDKSNHQPKQPFREGRKMKEMKYEKLP